MRKGLMIWWMHCTTYDSAQISTFCHVLSWISMLHFHSFVAVLCCVAFPIACHFDICLAALLSLLLEWYFVWPCVLLFVPYRSKVRVVYSLDRDKLLPSNTGEWSALCVPSPGRRDLRPCTMVSYQVSRDRCALLLYALDSMTESNRRTPRRHKVG